MNTITNEMINTTTNDYSLFLAIKKNLIKGQVVLQGLSSKNRAHLHKICSIYGLEHSSTGSYDNRTIIIKDTSHTYFSNNYNNNRTSVPCNLSNNILLEYDETCSDNTKINYNDLNNILFISGTPKLQSKDKSENESNNDTNDKTYNDETDNDETDNDETDNDETDNDETDNDETDNDETDNDETDNDDSEYSDDSVSVDSSSMVLSQYNNNIKYIYYISLINLAFNFVILCNI